MRAASGLASGPTAFLYVRDAAQEPAQKMEPQSSPTAVAEESATVKVFVHDSTFSSEELLVSPIAFPDVQDQSVVFVDFSTRDDKKARVVLKATLMKGEEEATKSKRFALSLLKPVAEAFDVAPWADASVEPCNDPANEAAAEYVEFMFKDQFVSRADLWRFKRLVIGRTLHVGQHVAVGGMRASTNVLRAKESCGVLASGCVVASTRLTFRTRSSRIFWLVQLSYESWEPTGGADGATHVERLVDGFAAPLLQRWRKLDVNHSLSVVLFARVSGGGIESHRDVYRVVLENEAASKAEPATLVSALKRELVAFAASLASVVPPDSLKICRAADGNVLEAINLTLNVLEKHYMDRDVQRTGNSIVLISAGSGVFAVDGRLERVTKQRMMDNGIGMDMLSLAVPPLHTAPIFMHRGINNTKATAYEVPHWINLSFVDPERAADALAWVAAAAPRRARDGWRMAKLDLLTNEPEEEEPVAVDPAEQAKVRALARRRRRMPDMLAHLVGAELDTSIPQKVPPRRFQQSSGRCLPSVSFGSPGNLAQSLGTEDASSLASSAGAPWRPWFHLGSPADACLSWREKSTPDELEATHRRTPSQISEDEEEGLPYAYDVSASFAGSLSTASNLSKSPPARRIAGLQPRPRPARRVPPVPSPDPADLAARFDAHDMMAYYATDDDTSHLKPRATLSGEGVFGSPPDQAGSFGGPRPVRRRRGASFGDSITKGHSPPQNIPGAGLLGGAQAIQAARAELKGPRPPPPRPLKQRRPSDEKASPPRNPSALHHELAATEKHKSAHRKDPDRLMDAPVHLHFVNPFIREDEVDVLNHLSHNRRRWSHVFPDDEDEVQLVETGRVPGPNWRSLCTPAVLPVETDVLPEDFGRVNAFEESNHSVLLPHGADLTTEVPETVAQMVAQRIAGDYQLVDDPQSAETPSLRRSASQLGLHKSVAATMDRSLHNAPSRDLFPHSSRRRSRVKSQKPLMYTLSMGHRIQVLAYNRVERRVDVRAYRSRFGSNADPANRFDYQYGLWCGETGTFETKKQTFLKYPAPETNWNTLDQVLAGYLPPSVTHSTVKLRRVQLEIVPPRLQDDLEGDDYASRFAKFEQFLNAKRRAGEAPLDVGRVEGDALYRRPRLLALGLESDGGWRDEWLALECDSVVARDRCYRLALHWLLCSGHVVGDFLQAVRRRATQLRLTLVQVPEYTVRVNIHPFIAHVPVLKGALRSTKVSAAVERALTARLDFVRDSASAVAASSASQHKRGGTAPVATRQYVHRGGAAFVRADDGGGLLWIRNRLRREAGPSAALLASLRAHAAVLRALVAVVDTMGPLGVKAETVIDSVADFLVAVPDEDAPMPSNRLATDAPLRSDSVRSLQVQTPAKDGSRPPTPVPPSAGGSPVGVGSGRMPGSTMGPGVGFSPKPPGRKLPKPSGRKLDLL